MKIDLNKYKAFIFDFDGVIVDSVNIKTLAFIRLFERYGNDLVAKIVKHHKSHGGVSRFDKIRHYHKAYLKKDISERQVGILANRFSGIVLGQVVRAPFIKGVLDFMNTLKEKNLFLISATPEDEIKLIVRKRGLHKYFTDILGSPRTKKENLKALIAKYGLNYRECVYFGDSQEDKLAAADFKIRFVPINYNDKKRGYRNFYELMQS